jgi:hypothetical protein
MYVARELSPIAAYRSPVPRLTMERAAARSATVRNMSPGFDNVVGLQAGIVLETKALPSVIELL